MKKITIKWGTDKEETKTYTFENKEQAKFFMDGVHLNGHGYKTLVSALFKQSVQIEELL